MRVLTIRIACRCEHACAHECVRTHARVSVWECVGGSGCVCEHVCEYVYQSVCGYVRDCECMRVQHTNTPCRIHTCAHVWGYARVPVIVHVHGEMGKRCQGLCSINAVVSSSQLQQTKPYLSLPLRTASARS